MSDHQAKAAVYDSLVETAKALASGRRAELVDVLAQGERAVDELASEIDQSVANTSQHLQRLLKAGLVRTRRDGTRVYYSLSGSVVHRLWRTMREVAETHVEELDEVVRAYLGDRYQFGAMSRDELRARLSEGDVVVLDVRPRAEYDAGHIRGAMSVPITELKSRLDEIPEGAEIVAYCRGPFCLLSYDAVRYLTTKGRSAIRLEDGFPEWVDEDLPVD